jgi:hypothetical protein
MPMQSLNTNSRPSDIPVYLEDKWPVSKSELTNRNLKQFINYTNSMDLEKINQSNE